MFGRYGKRPFSIGELNKDQLSLIDRSKYLSCGIDKYRWLFSVQDFFFSKFADASCRLHDVYYIRGGNLLDKWKGDWHFFAKMIKDMFVASVDMVTGQPALANRVGACFVSPFYFLALASLSVIYFLAVFLFAWSAFNFGNYRKWAEIERILKRGR